MDIKKNTNQTQTPPKHNSLTDLVKGLSDQSFWNSTTVVTVTKETTDTQQVETSSSEGEPQQPKKNILPPLAEEEEQEEKLSVIETTTPQGEDEDDVPGQSISLTQVREVYTQFRTLCHQECWTSWSHLQQVPRATESSLGLEWNTQYVVPEVRLTGYVEPHVVEHVFVIENPVACNDIQDAKGASYLRVLQKKPDLVCMRPRPELYVFSKKIFPEQSILKVNIEDGAHHIREMLKTVDSKARLVIQGVFNTNRYPSVLKQLVLIHPQLMVQIQIPEHFKSPMSVSSSTLQQIFVCCLRFSSPYVVQSTQLKAALHRLFPETEWLVSTVDWLVEMYRACPLLVPRTSLDELVLWMWNQVWTDVVSAEVMHNTYYRLLQDALQFEASKKTFRVEI